jgi:hypothetical protein
LSAIVFTTENTAVFAPIPSPSVTTMVAVSVAFWRIVRQA